ncbi:sigma-70 family RNA polymerase sigma factor [Luteitalea sp.]|uniref:RNA polymerase sigma factor n=1 Tax=Luteitalea sp. TaxID=2004800 RepID=UPI0025C2D337|nr:sigma-70 family RNA polymerase sigma factor [Luteitalea sp.]
MSGRGESEVDAAVANPQPTDVLLENHRAFLRYLERRTGSRASAEDLLQDAFVRHLDRLTSIPDEGLVPWFYRVLRNAAIDRHRRHVAETHGLAAFAEEMAVAVEPSAELHLEICQCVGRLAQTLKPEYAQAIRAVDIDEMPVKGFAEAAGLTPSTAGVRLFRARAALRKQVVRSCGTCAEHGCLDCSCRTAGGGQGCNESGATA